MVSLRKINEKNVWKLLALEVFEEQKDFVASNTVSLVEAYITLAEGGHVMPFGIYDGETPVGFVMLGYGDEPDSGNPPIAEDNYCLWRLMIDRAHQKKGYGRQAVRLALEYIRTFPCGKAEACWVSFEPENRVAAELYHSFGFRENGDTCDGESVAVLKL